MSDPLLNTVGRCRACGGVVSNSTGRRLSRDKLERIHAETCPGLHRSSRSKKE